MVPSPKRKRAPSSVNSTIIWEEMSMVWIIRLEDWWPGLVITSTFNRRTAQRSYSVFSFGEHCVLQLTRNIMVSFKDNYQSIVNNRDIHQGIWLKAVIEALREISHTSTESFEELHKWATNKLFSVENRLNEIPKWIKTIIRQNNVKCTDVKSVQANHKIIKDDELPEDVSLDKTVIPISTRNHHGNVASTQNWEVGSVVWVKFERKWWPAMVIQLLNPIADISKLKCLIFWFSDRQISKVSATLIIPFQDNYERIFTNAKRTGAFWLRAVEGALQELANTPDLTFYELKEWANSGFRGAENRSNKIPTWIMTLLRGSSVAKSFQKTSEALDGNQIPNRQEAQDENIPSTECEGKRNTDIYRPLMEEGRSEQQNQNEVDTKCLVYQKEKGKHINTSLICSTGDWEVGSVVWAEYLRKWWPAMIIGSLTKPKYVVFWFGSKRISKVSANIILPFKDNYKNILNEHKKLGKLWLLASKEALQELANTKVMTFKQLQDWVENNMPGSENRLNEIPNWIKKILEKSVCLQNNAGNYTFIEKQATRQKRKLPNEKNTHDSSSENGAATPVIQIKHKQNSTPSTSSAQIWENGSLVWAEFCKVWWSAMVIDQLDYDYGQEKYTVFWFSDKMISQVSSKKIISFKENYEYVVHNTKNRSKQWLTGLEGALKELAQTNEKNFTELQKWAEKKFPNSKRRINEIPNWIKILLKKYNYKRINKGYQKPSGQGPRVINKHNLSEDQKANLKRLNESGKPLNGICLTCYTTDVVDEHPYFFGQICADCKDNIICAIRTTDSNASARFCIICADPHPTIFCKNDICTYRAYCNRCMDNLAAPTFKKKLEKLAGQWLCFRCKRQPVNGIICPRHDFEVMVQQLFNKDACTLINNPVLSPRRKLRVLSLFDTLAAGLIALNQLNIPVDIYYSFGTDLNAINISELKEQITDLGNLEDFHSDNIDKIGDIDLLLIGSPSVIMNLSKPNLNGIYGTVGRSIHFFEFYRILAVLSKSFSHSLFWFFEAPASASVQYKNTITRYLQCEPVELDVPWIALKQKPRLLWGNLPTINKSLNKDLKRNVPLYASKCKSTNIEELEGNLGFKKVHMDVVHSSITKRKENVEITWSVNFFKHLLQFLSDFYDN